MDDDEINKILIDGLIDVGVSDQKRIDELEANNADLVQLILKRDMALLSLEGQLSRLRVEAAETKLGLEIMSTMNTRQM